MIQIVATPSPRPATSVETWPWEELYDSLVPRLLGLAMRRYGLSREDAEDCVQRVAMEISLAGSAVRNREAYFTSAFLRHCQASLKRRNTEARENVPFDIANPSENPRERIEAALAFEQAMGLVPPHCREAIRSWVLEGETMRGSAEKSSWSKANAYRRFHRCMKRLVDAL